MREEMSDSRVTEKAQARKVEAKSGLQGGFQQFEEMADAHSFE